VALLPDSIRSTLGRSTPPPSALLTTHSPYLRPVRLLLKTLVRVRDTVCLSYSSPSPSTSVRKLCVLSSWPGQARSSMPMTVNAQRRVPTCRTAVPEAAAFKPKILQSLVTRSATAAFLLPRRHGHCYRVPCDATVSFEANRIVRVICMSDTRSWNGDWFTLSACILLSVGRSTLPVNAHNGRKCLFTQSATDALKLISRWPICIAHITSPVYSISVTIACH